MEHLINLTVMICANVTIPLTISLWIISIWMATGKGGRARNGLSRLRMALRKIRSPLRIVLCITALINAVASSASTFTLIWSVLYLVYSGFMCIARLYCLCKGLDAAKWTQALVITSILALVYMLQKLQRPRRNPSAAAPACEQIVPCIVDAA